METNYDVGKWIEIARISRSMTQKELADKVTNLSQSNLSKMEKGLLSIPKKTLDRIASELNYPLQFFKDRTVRTPLSAYYYRKRITMPKKEKDILEARFDILRRTIDCLLSNIELPELKIISIDDDNQTTPEEAAEFTRRLLKLGRGPVANICMAIESSGLVIYELDNVSEKFDGITLITDNGHNVIVINKNLPNDRKRFTIAHELGHFVLHIKSHFIPNDRDTESEANRFASEFLFPKQEALRSLSNLKLGDLGILKTQWLISKAAIIYRAKELGLISLDKRKYFMIELSRNGERKNEKGFVDIDSPQIIKQAIEVYKELNYSENDLSIISKLSVDDFKYYFIEDSTPRLKVAWRNAN